MIDVARKQETVSADAISDKSLGRKFFNNTAALMIGWNVNAVGRLVTAALIVRRLGISVFGQYALIVVWVTIAEWILDFGTTEVFVREANHAPERRSFLVRVVLALKLVQAPLAVLVMLGGMIAMQYSRDMVLAGAVAAISLLFVAGVVLCRAVFKASLTMGREVVSEFVSVVVMMAAVPLVSHMGWGLMGLMAVYAISRCVFLIGCLMLSRGLISFSVRDVGYRDLKWGVTASYTIGLIGFLSVVYSTSDLLVLSRIANLSEIALYSAAQRWTQPLVMVLNAVAVSVYPVLALLKSPSRFRETCQHALETTVLLGGLALVGLWCGAEFFMRLLGRDFVSGGNALRILAAVCVFRAISMVIGPVLFLVRAQGYALGYMFAGLIVKTAMMILLAPRFGYLGAAAGTLLAEALFMVPVTLYYVHSFTGFKLRWSGLLRILTIVASVIAVTRLILPQGNLASAALGAFLYAAVILAVGLVRPAEVRALLRRDAAA